MKTTLAVLLTLQLYGLTSCVNKEHYFINLVKTWYNAQQYCRTYFYDLSTFTNVIEEQQFLDVALGLTSDAWIGLYKESGIWKWAGGQVAKRISWDATQPDNSNCAFLHKDHMKLHDKTCTEDHFFFCMNITFVLVQQNETWETALEYCRDQYDDLATLNSNRMEYAVSKSTEAQTEYVWIGLRFLAGEWIWVSGDDPHYEALSEAGQPQCPPRNQHCGALDKKTNKWMHRDCVEKLNFLCF